MIDLCCIKPIQREPSLGEERKGRSPDQRDAISRETGSPGVKLPTSLLMITDGRVAHSDTHVDDDDFVDPPHRFHEKSPHNFSPMGDGQSTGTSNLQTPHSDRHPSNDVVEDLRKQFNGQM
ncbi:Hypothetical predicted protein [Olea europaea subsp. europaea]|uniref:Uncharacterized protein n=1 Tax=Olea europaea subsp. europaea TaxID=158383 RepID=A0A8S0RAX5_OLEEU|nr:Hypothetical predicted protein [Olea europaea subsp. europaea]